MKKISVLLLALALFATIYAGEEKGTKPGTQTSTRYESVTISTQRDVIFQETFNGSNTVAALEARGWVVINADGGGTTAPWYQGSTQVFNAFEGPDTGYVASNYNGANGFYINHWLISPPVIVSAGDTLSFYHRSPDANPYDDSIFVRYSTTAGTTPAAFDQTWGKYRTGEAGWQLWTGTFSHSGAVRFAIQYYITNGGPSGANSNYMGLDLVQIKGPVVPVELTSFNANVKDGAVVLNWSTATETNNTGFEVEKKQNGQFFSIGFIKGSGTTSESRNYTFVDNKVEAGTYTYRLKQIDLDGSFEYSKAVEVIVAPPAIFALNQNYPNPFNPSTKINFSLAVDSKVSLTVFNILGQKISILANSNFGAGVHGVAFDATKLNSGIYIYKLEAVGIDGSRFTATKKMMLTK